MKPKNKLSRKLLKVAVRLVLAFLIITNLVVILYSFVPVPISPLMVIRSVQQKQAGKELRLKKDWVSFDALPNNLQLAVVCTEDQNFLKHNGFDFEQIKKAVEENKQRKKARGASTISQQTAKNVFLWPKSSWVRKGLEVYFTMLIELWWSKERIMTVYLNVIEFGDGIYGAEAAAQHFFGKPAIKLNNSQAALLASVLPNPLKYNAERPGVYLRKRQLWTLNQMRLWGGKLEYKGSE